MEISSQDNAPVGVYVSDNGLISYSDVERLWSTVAGGHRDQFYSSPQDAVEELVTYGDTAAELILRDLNEAFEVEYNDAGEIANVYVNEDFLGGFLNIPLVEQVLLKIGGNTARQALALLSMIDDVDETGEFERRLGRAGTPEAIHVLTCRLSSSSRTVALAAATALRKIRTASAPAQISTFAAALTGTDAEAAIVAANALGKIGPDAVDTLLTVFSPDARVSNECVDRGWGNSEETVRSAAARALGKIGDRRAVDALVGAIDTYDVWTSEAAILALVALGGDPRTVLPILQANLLLEETEWDWHYWDRIKAAHKMGPQAFEMILAATEDPDALTRALALRALAESAEVNSGAENPERQERMTSCVVAGLKDPSASVRVSAIELCSKLDIPNKGALLVTLLTDSKESEQGDWFYCDDKLRSVGDAAAYHLPNDDATLECLRRELAEGRLNAVLAWESFVDSNGETKQIRGSVQHGEAIAPYILEAAKRAGEEVHEYEFSEVRRALGWAATRQALECLGVFEEARTILDACDDKEIGTGQLWEPQDPQEVEAMRQKAAQSPGKLLPRRAYQVGNEYLGRNNTVWKVARREPDIDWWYTLYFDVLKSNDAVDKHHKVSWLEPGKPSLKALRAVAPGTFDAAVRKVEAKKAAALKAPILKARHGADPRLLVFPDKTTVQQFADTVGVPAAEVKKLLRERRGILLGKGDQIAPDALSDLSDDYNVIPI